MTATNIGQRPTTRRSLVQTAALAIGAVFLLVGILGFVPGITTNAGEIGFAGHHSGAMLLGIFQVSVLHNAVHLLFGAAGILMSRTAGAAKQYLVWGGVIYLVLWVYGLVIGHDSPANFVPLNAADNWLHLALGVAMLGLGLVVGRKRA